MTRLAGYSADPSRPLTPVMRQALAALSEGQTPQQLALARGVSVGTVYAELALARERLGASTTPQACVLFQQAEQ